MVFTTTLPRPIVALSIFPVGHKFSSLPVVLALQLHNPLFKSSDLSWDGWKVVGGVAAGFLAKIGQLFLGLLCGVHLVSLGWGVVILDVQWATIVSSLNSSLLPSLTCSGRRSKS